MMLLDTWKIHHKNKEIILNKNELHIWRTKISTNIDKVENYWHLLAQDEQAHAKKFHFIIDRNMYIIGRAILKKLIEKYTCIPFANIKFAYTEHGKPILDTNSNFQQLKFNLSHSKDSIIYGFTRSIDVGVDTEYVNKKFNIIDMVKYYCTKQEQNKLLTLTKNQKYSYLYKLWVTKEALVKAMGQGLLYDLNKIYINFDKAGLINAVNIINNNKIDYTINMFLSYDDYYNAFALKYPVEKVIFLTYNL